MLIDLKLKELNKDDFTLLSQRYGFFNISKTLEEIGKESGITRERVRQKQSRAVRRLKELLQNDQDLKSILNKIIEAAKNNISLSRIKGFSINYKDDAVIRMLIDIFLENDVKIFINRYLKNPILICKKREEEINSNILNIKNILEIQKEYVYIDDIVNFLNCNENLIKEYKLLVFKGEKVAVTNNKNIFLDRLAILENLFQRHPYKIFNKKEILEKMNIKEGQLRGLIDRSDKIVCLEKSKYAYSKNYKGGSSIKLVYGFLSEAEKPMTFKNIMSLVKKERPFIKGSSVKAAIKLCDKIDEIDNNLFALGKWDYESEKKGLTIKKYKHKLKEALRDIFTENVDTFFSVRDLKKCLFEKYENNVSSNDSSIYVILYKLIDNGFIFKMTKGKSAYYKKK